MNQNKKQELKECRFCDAVFLKSTRQFACDECKPIYKRILMALSYDRRSTRKKHKHIVINHKQRALRNRINLADSYVLTTLNQMGGVKGKDVPKELIEAKRLQLILFRAKGRKWRQYGNQDNK